MIKKRAPLKPSTTASDIYVKSSSNTKQLIKRIRKLLNLSSTTSSSSSASTSNNKNATDNANGTINLENAKTVTVHGLGKAVVKAVELCLCFKREHEFPEKVEFTIKTRSETLLDDHEGLEIDDEDETKIRLNSSIHIRIRLL